MVESSLAAVRRLLTTAIEECENDECAFRVRTALQLLEAVEADLQSAPIDSEIFEEALQDDDLRERLEEAGIITREE